jgi:hypothetical protein
MVLQLHVPAIGFLTMILLNLKEFTSKMSIEKEE